MRSQHENTNVQSIEARLESRRLREPSTQELEVPSLKDATGEQVRMLLEGEETLHPSKILDIPQTQVPYRDLIGALKAERSEAGPHSERKARLLGLLEEYEAIENTLANAEKAVFLQVRTLRAALNESLTVGLEALEIDDGLVARVTGPDGLTALELAVQPGDDLAEFKIGGRVGKSRNRGTH